MLSPEQQLRELKRGVVDLHVEAELLARLKAGKPLKIKAGFDPTRPDLHLGHVVLMRKMRQFQDLGHEVVFVVGSFTAQIGDPSGRNATRPVASKEEIMLGAQSYAEQAFKILDRERVQVVYNHDWLDPMRFGDVIRLASRYPLARMMERDDFKKRWQQHTSISIHELLYPLAQGYDSVVLNCDVELGGTDQLFNLLVGRELMREHGQKPQIVMTTPILEGLNARFENGRIVGDKMSKSLDNYVAVNEPPLEQFGKLMSVSDELMWRYYELLSTRDVAEIKSLQHACDQNQHNPRDAKLALAQEIVSCFHGASIAQQAQDQWQAQFSQKQMPENIPEFEISTEGEIWIPKALAEAGLVKSSSDGRRRIEQGGVEIDGQRITDPKAALKPGRYQVKAGKRNWAVLVVRG